MTRKIEIEMDGIEAAVLLEFIKKQITDQNGDEIQSDSKIIKTLKEFDLLVNNEFMLTESPDELFIVTLGLKQSQKIATVLELYCGINTNEMANLHDKIKNKSVKIEDIKSKEKYVDLCREEIYTLKNEVDVLSKLNLAIIKNIEIDKQLRKTM